MKGLLLALKEQALFQVISAADSPGSLFKCGFFGPSSQRLVQQAVPRNLFLLLCAEGGFCFLFLSPVSLGDPWLCCTDAPPVCQLKEQPWPAQAGQLDFQRVILGIVDHTLSNAALWGSKRPACRNEHFSPWQMNNLCTSNTSKENSLYFTNFLGGSQVLP